MIIEETRYPGWVDYPAYRCRSHDDYLELSKWMKENGVKWFLLSSGSGGYIFQIRERQLLFWLRWG